MTLTKQQWEAVEKSLAYPHGRVELLCDGTTKVVAEVRQTKPLRFHVVVFVDGFWRSEWLRAEPGRNEHRFLNMHDRALHPPKSLARAKKVLSAAQYRKMAAARYVYFSPAFPTGKSFRRRISSTCQDIRLIDCTEAAIAALEAKRKALADEIDGMAEKEPA